MADYLDFFQEHFADQDSEFSDSDFEGFEEEDIVEREEQEEEDPFENWIDGDGQKEILNFSGRKGLLVEMDVESTPMDYINKLIGDVECNEIAVETNRYADQLIAAKQPLPPYSRFKKWKPTTGPEIMRFIAIIMAMGIVNQSNITDYWSRDPVCETPFFPSIMNRDRFLNLISCLHLANNELYVSRGQPGYNPLFKLGTVYSTVLARYPLLFGPNQELSIDEGKVPWRGNLHFKVYHKNKPVKYGLQAYMLCDASTGYCLKFHLYTGKTFRQNILETGHGRTYDLCMHLLKGYFGKGHIMYCDNYYSSPRLFVDLWELGVGALGTVRSNRKGIPASIREKHLPNRGDTFSQHTGQLSITKYLDSKPVFLLSTTLTSEKMYTGKKNPVTQELISKPKMVIAYDKFMGGVDRADQMVSNSRSKIRTMKWWKKVFFHVLSLTVLNSYIAYKHNSIHPMSHSSFHKKLVSQLIESHPLDALVTPVSGRPKTQFLERLTARHFPSKIPNDGKSKSLQCVVCNPAVAQMLASQGLPKKRRPGHETAFKCRQCDVSLCIVPCFELYHTMQDYILAYKRLQAEE